MLRVNHSTTIAKQCAGALNPSRFATPWREEAMKSSVVKRSTIVAGHKTSVSLEDAFWNDLRKIATEHEMTLSDLVSKINSDRQQGNLSSAIRLFVLDFYRDQISEHQRKDARDGNQPHGPDGTKAKTVASL
jgi:predicted DNA-binding ribbon-helix-helix protein